MYDTYARNGSERKVRIFQCKFYEVPITDIKATHKIENKLSNACACFMVTVQQLNGGSKEIYCYMHMLLLC
jgi:hypothetical protein